MPPSPPVGVPSLVALIAMTAGWIAGLLTASRPQRQLVAAIGYSFAFLGASAGLSIIQAAWDSLDLTRVLVITTPHRPLAV